MNDIDRLVKERGGIKLDVGCGANKQGIDWVGIDSQPLPGVDIVHDLLDIPWPLPDDCVMTARCSHVLEHIPKVSIIYVEGKLVTINPLIMVMNEMWRIMRPDGQFLIAVPHGHSNGFLRDPTHTSEFSEQTWAYFDPLVAGGQLYSFYRPRPWAIQTGPDKEPWLYYDPANNIEVVLVKRRLDKSYEQGH